MCVRGEVGWAYLHHARALAAALIPGRAGRQRVIEELDRRPLHDPATARIPVFFPKLNTEHASSTARLSATTPRH